MDILDVYELGNMIQFVRLAKHFPALVRGEACLLPDLRRTHSVLKSEGIGKGILDEMSSWIKKLDKNYPEEGTTMKGKDASDLTEAADKWREVLRKELSNIHVVVVEKQSGLNPNELRKIADQLPSEFISSEIWEKLTDIEKSDFSDAARGLLLGTATPSVMVALRGAEAAIRNYYRCKAGKEPEEKTWRQLTKELKDEAADLDIKATFIGYLDYIGDAKRNFAQHPNKIYNLREAVMIFMQVVALVEDIYMQI